MRLGALLLTAASLAAQQTRGLPWERLPGLPWRADAAGAEDAAAPLPASEEGGGLRATLEPDGALRVVDGKGIVLLRTGLPGRPRRAWRDGGRPLPSASGTWSFPARTPLRGGIGALPLGQADFRPGLEGLLWVLDDEERILTVLHPATCRVAHLPLPGGSGLDLRFLPDRLVVRQGFGGGGSSPRSTWSLPWLSLLPQLILLATPAPAPKPGTALQPFPRE